MFLKRTFPWSVICVVFCLIFIQSCQESVPEAPGLEPEGTLVAYSGCKRFESSSTSGEPFAPQSHQECIEYSYNGGTLWVKHINAAFNCCLDGIVGNVNIEGNVIRIESEGILANGQGCFCDCLYDLEYEIKNIEPAVYILIMPTFSHSLEIDLSRKTSDTYCEPRDRYPWN